MLMIICGVQLILIWKKTKINQFYPLITRIDKKKVDAMIEDSKDTLVKEAKGKKPKKELIHESNLINIKDFSKIDLAGRESY